MARRTRTREPDAGASRRGALLVHPVAFVAVATLAFNDHLFKAAMPGFMTGKLSDVAGLAVFPLLLAEVLGLLLRRDARRLIRTSAVVTAITFALVKVTVVGATAYAWAVGILQWVVTSAFAGHAEIRQVAVVMDSTDLLALPAVLVAVAVAGRPQLPVALARAVSRGRRGRLARISMTVATAAATMATSPAPPPPTGVVVSEQVHIATGEIAVRHITWSVAKEATASSDLRLEVSIRGGGEKNPDASPSKLILALGPEPDSLEPVRIVPDDPRLASAVKRDGFEYEYTTATLTLGGTCQATCTGGGRILVTGTTGLLVMRLTTGRPSDIPALSLRADGVGDYTGAIGLADSGAQEAQIDLDPIRLTWHGGYTLHLTGAALQAPYQNLRLILRTRVAGVDDKAGLDAAAKLSIGESTLPIDLGGSARWHVFDLAERCDAGSPCEIPIALDVAATLPTAPGATPGRGVDVYRWNVRVEVLSFDGRAVPVGGAWITATEP